MDWRCNAVDWRCNAVDWRCNAVDWRCNIDAPSMHTMYIDKPMKGHSLMQAIARVNPVYGDKPSGLIVDY